MSKIIRKSKRMSIYQINNLTQEQKKKTFVTTYVDQETHRGHGGKKPKQSAISKLTEDVKNLTKIVMQLVEGQKDTNTKIDNLAASQANMQRQIDFINNVIKINNLKTK